MTLATSDTLKQILIEAGHYETAPERHAVDVDGCTMTTYRWVRQKSGEFTLWSSFQFDMTGAELPFNRGAQFVAMPGPMGSQDTSIVYFQMRAPFEARFEKSNLRGKEAGSIPSLRNDGTTHSYETSVSFSICILDRMLLPRPIVTHAPLKIIVQNTVCCWGSGVGLGSNGQTRSGESPKNQVVSIKKRPAKWGVFYFDQTAD